MMRFAQRYLFAAVAFAIAAVWTGVGLVSSFECLLVFGLAALAVAAVQRRHEVAANRARRARPGRRGERRRSRSSSAWPARPRAYDEGASDDWQRAARSDW
jgi:hypothetical protein